MRLTNQMKTEMDAMQIRVYQIVLKVDPCLIDNVFERKDFFEQKEIIDACIQEVTTYKVRLENLLSQTDIKEQANLELVIY